MSLVAVILPSSTEMSRNTTLSPELRRSPARFVWASLILFVALTSTQVAVYGQKKTAPEGTTPAPVRENFEFTKVDLELLEQIELLDRRFQRDGMVLDDPATNEYISRIGRPLIPKELVIDKVAWKFRILRDPEPNAFALPNGSIYVTTGLVSIVDNESQLAAILAHEMTHVLARHGYMQNRSNRKKYLTMNIMSAVAAYAPGGVVGAAIYAAASVAPFLVMSSMYGYSRDLERDADHRAIDMMISAEYPPEELINVLKNLNKDIEGEQIKTFYSDHPQLDERISYLTQYLGSRADKVTPQMVLNRERMVYFQRMEPVMKHNIQLAMNAARFRSAVFFAQRLVQFRPTSAENVFLLGEAYRMLGPHPPEFSTQELSNGQKKDLAGKRNKQTLEEQERELLASPAGQANWKSNQQKAEEYYQQALAMDTPFPTAHRGLGMLYEKLGRTTDAITEYEKYLSLVPAATDLERIQRRIDALRKL